MKERKIHPKAVESGLKLFSIGLGYKVLLANQIGTLWNSIMTAGAGNLSAAVAWLGAFAYSFQIYFDFWGYSLMDGKQNKEQQSPQCEIKIRPVP